MGHPPSLGLLLPLRCHGSAPFSTALLSCSPCRTASPAQDESHTLKVAHLMLAPLLFQNTDILMGGTFIGAVQEEIGFSWALGIRHNNFRRNDRLHKAFYLL